MIRSYRIIFFLIMPLVNGCLVMHNGNVSSGSQMNRTDQFVDIAVGKSRSVFVLGFGDLNNEDLVMKAKYNLYFNRPLVGNEYYANVTTSYTNKFIFFFAHITKVSVSADVLRSKDSVSEPFSKNFRRLIGSDNYLQTIKYSEFRTGKKNGNILVKGDSIYYSPDKINYSLYTVLSTNNKTVLLKASNAVDRNTLAARNNLFFIKNINISGFKSGDVAEFDNVNYNYYPYNGECVVLGVSESSALVKIKNTTLALPLTKLKKKPESSK